MATVRIKNLLRRMRVFNLEHPHFVNTTGEHPVGKPEAVTFLALEEKELPQEALQCREIKKALTRHPKRRPTLRVLS